MHVEFYEKIWMWAAAGLLVLFVGIMVLTAVSQAVTPPSHVETIDPKTLATNPDFKPGIVSQPDGGVTVTVVGEDYDFNPNPIEVPANRPVTFRLTSADVMHGFEVVGTNANAMMIPGYVSQFTMIFKQPGEYTIGCNEYCGIMHHNMVGKLIVK
jgi:cytochrome c oxidase subunit II